MTISNYKHRGIEPERKTYTNMIDRCYDERHKDYPKYGARGITVSQDWLDNFEHFYRDMGKRPPGRRYGYSIDRIDNDGNYEKGNCRWATPTEQNSNKRNSRYLTINNITQTIAAWDRALGFGKGTLRSRIRRGMSPENACVTPRWARTTTAHQLAAYTP